MKDSIVPKAIGFLTNNFISSNKYRREKRDYPRWSNKEREGKREKLFQFSFKRVCTSILCALTVVQYLFLSRTIIAIETLVQEEEEDKKKKGIVGKFIRKIRYPPEECDNNTYYYFKRCEPYVLYISRESRFPMYPVNTGVRKRAPRKRSGLFMRE